MPAVNSGRDLIAGLLIGEGTALDSSNAALGVGDSNNSHDATQAELEAERLDSGSKRKGMDSGFPNRDPDGAGHDHKVAFQASFGQNEANFEWHEWGVFNSTGEGAGDMINRKVEYLGEKTDAAQWVLEVEITINI